MAAPPLANRVPPRGSSASSARWAAPRSSLRATPGRQPGVPMPRHSASHTQGPGWRPRPCLGLEARAPVPARHRDPLRGRHREAPARALHGRSPWRQPDWPLHASLPSARCRLCPPNTADKLRSGARVHPSRRGHEPAPPSAERCRRKLRLLHPLVRQHATSGICLAHLDLRRQLARRDVPPSHHERRAQVAHASSTQKHVR